MKRPLGLVAACLAPLMSGCSSEPKGIAVRIVDEQGRALRDVKAWSLPAMAVQRPQWVPAELRDWGWNTHELLRRLGDPVTVAASGIAYVAPGSVVAAQQGELAGFVAVVQDAAAADLVLRDACWTIQVRNAAGQPMPDVPVGGKPLIGHRAEPDRSDEFEGLPFGRTDASGTLVVRAVRDLDLHRFLLRTAGEPAPPLPDVVWFEVEGMYLPNHGAWVNPLERRPVVTFTMPEVVEVAIEPPTWQGPLSDAITLTRTGKGMLWDNCGCRPIAGRHHAFVGVPPDGSMPVCVLMQGTSLGNIDVSRTVDGQPFVARPSLADDDTVVRGRLHDTNGQPLAQCEVEALTPEGRSSGALTDGTGRFALILSEWSFSPQLRLRIVASRDPTKIGHKGQLNLPDAQPGARLDVGDIRLVP